MDRYLFYFTIDIESTGPDRILTHPYEDITLDADWIFEGPDADPAKIKWKSPFKLHWIILTHGGPSMLDIKTQPVLLAAFTSKMDDMLFHLKLVPNIRQLWADGSQFQLDHITDPIHIELFDELLVEINGG